MEPVETKPLPPPPPPPPPAYEPPSYSTPDFLEPEEPFERESASDSPFKTEPFGGFGDTGDQDS